MNTTYIIGYYCSPFTPLTANHILVVFNDEDMDGNKIAYSPTEGLCYFCMPNMREWERITLADFIEINNDVPMPKDFLKGEGTQVKNVKDVCNAWFNYISNPKRIFQRVQGMVDSETTTRSTDKSRSDTEGNAERRTCKSLRR